MEITNQLLKAYAENNVLQEERLTVRQYLTDNPQELESVLIMMDEDADIMIDKPQHKNYCCNIVSVEHDVETFESRLDDLIDELDLDCVAYNPQIIPMTAMAAKDSINTLCAIRCEGYALRHFGFDVSDEQLIEESRAAGWLKENGTALHNIGRLSGTRGLSVAHRYDCSIDNIRKELEKGRIVIAVVDKGELNGDLIYEIIEDDNVGINPDHAVIISDIDDLTITIIDSSTPQQTDTYPLLQFENAWNDSSNCLIVISNDDEYEPHPIDLSDVEISDDLIELREAIAENAHEVWAANRKCEGWAYGPVRDDAKKLHPDMKAYNRLPESEKLYDREMAINTIKLVKKLGYEIIKR